ncbi:hypothetical protein ILUMI_19813 [Ignelater luminosus]|uniref:PiggyBac transposable element-derived protein domain-containing protein n=1 Tax=Ignelater luminosus TaxID=2038154 RepID=A0A8K0CJQ8_IGNLU|nr:hypothetical protein ILUMI_19813 [Ignelater luminosus]
MVEKVANVDGTVVSVESWYDNKFVNMMSTYVGNIPIRDVRRFSKKDNIHITVPCPKAVTVYNKYMGGVDLLDSMLGYHRISHDRSCDSKWRDPSAQNQCKIYGPS